MRTDLVARLGLRVTRSWRRGAERGRGRLRPYTTSGCRVEVGPERTFDVPGLLTRLLDQIDEDNASVAVAIDELGLDAEVSAHIKMTDEAPVGTLDSRIVRRVAALGADLDLDLHVNWDE
jgi:Domain of unknown function (DUF4279)